MEQRFLRFAASLLLSALCGASWMLPVPWLGPLLSLGLAVLVLLQKTRWSRCLTALAYYAAGSVGLVQGVAVFFGPHASLFEGVFLWLGSAALLSSGWSFADKPWKAVLVLLFDALVPPLAFFDWMSPLTAAGVLFPGSGPWGIATLLIAVASLSLLRKQPDGWVLLVPVIFFCNVLYTPIPVPAGWRGVDLHVGPSPENLPATLQRRQVIIAQTRKSAAHARAVLLPETLVTAWSGTLDEFRQAVRPGQVWLLGASVPREPGVLTDSIAAIRHTGKPKVLFTSAFPVPVSMWRPWEALAGGRPGYLYRNGARYRASWWEPARRIDGKRAWASICYDQLLPAVWLEGVFQHPQVVLLTNNEWWAQGTRIPVIQRNSSWAWVRLMGAARVEAENF